MVCCCLCKTEGVLLFKQFFGKYHLRFCHPCLCKYYAVVMEKNQDYYDALEVFFKPDEILPLYFNE